MDILQSIASLHSSIDISRNFTNMKIHVAFKIFMVILTGVINFAFTLQVLVFVSKTTPIVLYIRDVEKLVSRSQRIYNLFQKMLNKLSGSILILGSQIIDPDDDYRDVDERLTALFPYNIEIRPPEDENHFVSWKNQLEEDMKMIQLQDNKNHIIEVLAANDLDCRDLDSICLEDTLVLSNYIEEIVVSAVSYHLMNNKDHEYRNGKLVISSKRLDYILVQFYFSFFNIITSRHLLYWL